VKLYVNVKEKWLRAAVEVGKMIDFIECLRDLKLKQPEQVFEQPFIN